MEQAFWHDYYYLLADWHERNDVMRAFIWARGERAHIKEFLMHNY